MTTRRCAIVTGSASGIGAATVLELARQGYNTVGIDVNFEGAVANAEVASQIAGCHFGLFADVTDEIKFCDAMRQAAAWLARSNASDEGLVNTAQFQLDALATCAGISETTAFMDLTVAQFRSVYDVNVIGTFIAMREAAHYMKSGGRICTVASVAGLRGGGLMGTAAYAASKGAVLALTKNAARSLGGQGISVNTVAPGATYTPMIAQAWADPLFAKKVESMAVQNRTAAPAEIAANIVYLLSPQASYVTGSTLVADGGLSMY
jgi:NAD(P)-dependent dehydrogenase (short-subunit alcohol dehydrogenase family)